MNKIVEEAYKILEENDVKNEYIPELEIGETYLLKDVWDGIEEVTEYENENGEKSYSYSYSLGGNGWYIDYQFVVLEEDEDEELDSVIKILNIEFL